MIFDVPETIKIDILIMLYYEGFCYRKGAKKQCYPCGHHSVDEHFVPEAA